MKKNIFLLGFLFLFFSCKKSIPVAQNEVKTSVSEEEIIHICSSVKAVGDEYIPLLNTNVFIKGEDKSLAERIEERLVYFHKLFDQYHYYYDDENSGTLKNFAIMNDFIARQEKFPCPEILSRLLSDSFLLMKLTNGNFNIFINPVFKLYDGYFSAFPIKRKDPDKEKISEALKRVPSVLQAEENFVIQENNVVVKNLASLDFSINPGAVAKGFVAHQIIKEFSDEKFLLSLGSSTIVASKRNARVGIASPYYRTLPLFQVDLPEKLFLSTSSTTNNYYLLEDDEKIVRCHIIDPKTGYSNNFYWAVIVISNNGTVSDALSTALFNVESKSEILGIIQNVKKEFDCSVEVCMVMDSSREEKTLELLMTPGFEPFVNKEFKGTGLSGRKFLK